MSGQRIYRRLLKAIESTQAGSLQDFLRRRAYPGRGGIVPPVIVMSLPKSGSIFLCRALCRVLKVRRARFGSYGFTEPTVQPKAVKRLKAGNCVCQEHLPASDHVVAALGTFVPGIVVHIRDPRRALVSWIGHLHDLLAEGRMVEALGFAECAMAPDYLDWSAERQLEWHVDHVLPRMIAWIQGWVQVHDDPAAPIRITFSTLEQLQADTPGALRRLLNGLGVAFREEWLAMPPPSVGRHNVRRDPSLDRKAQYPTALWDRASMAIPEDLRRRFNWS